MERLPAVIPKRLAQSLKEFYLPNNYQAEDIQIKIFTENENITVREIAAYLKLLDRFYGRLTREGLQSYSQRKYGQIQFETVKPGSVEFTISDVLRYLSEYQAIVYFLLIRYIPNAIKGFSEATNNFAQARKAWVETNQLITDSREKKHKKLSKALEEDEILGKLDKKSRTQISIALGKVYRKDLKLIRASQKFAKEKVIKVVLTFKRR